MRYKLCALFQLAPGSELISFVLLGCLAIRYWGEISLWVHSHCINWRKSAEVKKAAKKADKKEKLKAEVELEMKEKAASQGYGLPNQTINDGAGTSGRGAERAEQAEQESGGGHQDMKKRDSVIVNFG